ncbi:MAG: hypothetical protein RSC04_05705 [Bacteroidales bacterium]
MKKLFFTFLLLSLSTGGFSQNKASKYMYCEIQSKTLSFSPKINILIDSGQFSKRITRDNIMRDAKGSPLEFNSMIDALNQMNTLGWEFVQSYLATGGEAEACRWVLRKEIVEENTPPITK